MDLSASLIRQADQGHLTVVGELDAVTVVQVRSRLDDALSHGCTRFTVDVAGLTFIDAAGLGAFVRLFNATTRVGGDVTFVATSPTFLRVCGIAGLTEAFRLVTWAA